MIETVVHIYNQFMHCTRVLNTRSILVTKVQHVRYETRQKENE